MASDDATCVTVNELDVAEVSPVDAKVSVCAPDPSTRKFVKVATPPTAFTVVVPVSVPPPVIVTVTGAVLEVSSPPASRNSTTGCVVSALPLTAPDGCVVIATCVAGAEPTVMLAEFTVSAGDEVLNCKVCAPLPVSCNELNVATPPTAVAVRVPPSVPVPLAFDAVTTSAAPLPVVTSRPA